MPSVKNAERHLCRVWLNNTIMVSVALQSVLMLNVIILKVVAPFLQPSVKQRKDL
jgi:hypothetical protein